MGTDIIIRKLTSRKLWVAVAGFVSGILIFAGHSESEAAQVSALIMSGASVIAYCVGEGLADSSITGDAGCWDGPGEEEE